MIQKRDRTEAEGYLATESALIGHGVLVVPIVRNKGQENESQFDVNTIKKLHKLQRIHSLRESLVVIGY